MDDIEGKKLHVSDAIIACQFDGHGGSVPIQNGHGLQGEQPDWLHLSYAHPDSAEWLASTPLLPDALFGCPL